MIIIILIGACSSLKSQAQIFDKNNYIKIKPSDDSIAIVHKAARITPSARQLRWQELELTAFIHFGMNTFTNKEWGDGTENPSLFNPKKLDARQWVKVCKEAGFKQIILTAKHHDGFCLWPSKYTEHSVKNSPWKGGKGDVVKEVANACKEFGIGFGVYLSPWDRNSEYFGSMKYNDFFINQLTELLTNYGQIDEVWFDGANGEGPSGKKQVYEYNRWYELIRKLQPKATIAVSGPDVRWVGTETGYGRETEWSVVPANELSTEKIADNSQKKVEFAPRDLMSKDLGSRAKIVKAKSLVWYPAEIDVSIRPGWFYHPSEDNKVKTPEKLTDIYYSSVGRNGVLLLNIPPTTDGLISESDIKSLNGFRYQLNKTFRTNLLAEGVKNENNNRDINTVLDNKPNTFWPTKTKNGNVIIEFKMNKAKNFDVLLLQENLKIGQRVEQFVFEYKDGASWKVITEGTTIGFKRLLRFPQVTASQVRLRILSSRLNPAISEIGLYKQVSL
ncbi:alpha-L-fucosidase [Pedobacter boryungensis]|nr:alpha-L-fucosidase [Pedobacter boryungensis]